QRNARLAREWEVALPHELDLEQSKKLVHEFAQSLADEGMCVDANIHWKQGNHHAHILGTTRPITKNGTWGQKEKKRYKLD
ncbi:MobA/MobL family protein, partial [Erysipelatoclostridium ramosum]